MSLGRDRRRSRPESSRVQDSRSQTERKGGSHLLRARFSSRSRLTRMMPCDNGVITTLCERGKGNREVDKCIESHTADARQSPQRGGGAPAHSKAPSSARPPLQRPRRLHSIPERAGPSPHQDPLLGRQPEQPHSPGGGTEIWRGNATCRWPRGRERFNLQDAELCQEPGSPLVLGSMLSLRKPQPSVNEPMNE